MRRILLALIATACLPIVAQAGTITSFVKVTSGIFDQPTLAGFSTWAMRVTADTDWTNADLDISLSSGTLNHFLKPASFLGSPSIDPAPQGPGGDVRGDTAVFDPLFSLGTFGGAQGVPPTNPVPGTLVESTTTFAVTWFNTATTDTGDFDIAMITISDDANGELSFRTIAGTAVEDGGIGAAADTFEIVAGEIVETSAIPEPGTITLAAFGLIGMLASRRRS